MYTTIRGAEGGLRLAERCLVYGLGAAGATVGLIAGGVLTRYAGWQYIFYLNVPIGATALRLAPRIVPESRLATERRRFDVAGAIASTGGLVLLVDAISQAPQYGWGATRTLALLAASAALLVAFLSRLPAHQRGAADPTLTEPTSRTDPQTGGALDDRAQDRHPGGVAG